jgi:hypothetical protein
MYHKRLSPELHVAFVPLLYSSQAQSYQTPGVVIIQKTLMKEGECLLNKHIKHIYKLNVLHLRTISYKIYHEFLQNANLVY